MCIVYVTNLETGTFTTKTAWSKSRHTALVSHLGKWVGLVHELRQLVGAKEGIDHRRECLRVDQVRWCKHLVVPYIHSFTNGSCHPGKSNAELVHQLLSYCTHPSVTQVVDVIHIGLGVDQLNEVFDNLDNVFTCQHPLLHSCIKPQLFIEPVTAHLTQVITLVREEQFIDHIPGSGLIRWFGVPELPVNMHHRFLLRVTGVLLQGVVNNGKVIDIGYILM